MIVQFIDLLWIHSICDFLIFSVWIKSPRNCPITTLMIFPAITKKQGVVFGKKSGSGTDPDSAIKIACIHDYSHLFILRKINIICSFLEYHKIIEGTM